LLATVYLREGKSPQAEKLVNPVVHEFPDYMPAKKLLAEILEAQGKVNEAARLLEQMGAVSPEDLDLQSQLAMALLRARQSEKALEVLERLATRTESTPTAVATLVTALLQNQQFDNALAEAQRFYRENEGNVFAMRLLAETHVARGESSQAFEIYRQLLAVVPGDPAATLRSAEYLVEQNDLEGAYELIESALSKHPNDSGLVTVLAQVALQQGRASEAKTLLTRAIELAPNRQVTRVMLSGLLLAEGDPKGALAVLPVEPNAEDSRALVIRASSNLQLENYGEARDELERLAVMRPDSATVQLQLASVYAVLGEKENFDRALAQAADLAPLDVDIGLVQARALAARGQIEEAARVIGGLPLLDDSPAHLSTQLLIAEMQDEPNEQLRLAEELFNAEPSVAALFRLAKAQARAGHPDASERSLQSWLERRPNEDAVTFALAGFYSRSGRDDEAADLLRPLLAKYPDAVQLLNNQAWYLRFSAPAEALRLAEKAYRKAPENATVLDTYATLLGNSAQFDQALQMIDTAISLADDPLDFRVRRIEILEQANQVAQAKKELKGLRAEGIPMPLAKRVEVIYERLKLSE